MDMDQNRLGSKSDQNRLGSKSGLSKIYIYIYISSR